MSAPEWSDAASLRTVAVRGRLDEAQASQLVAELLALEARDAGALVTFVVDGPPGALAAALTVVDALGYVRAPIATCCRGRAGLTSIALLAAGARGHRSALASATLTLTEADEAPPRTQAEADARVALRHAFLSRVAQDAGVPITRLEDDVRARRTLSATEALEYGLIDRVGHLVR
jgi:ATP-dependent Clp protease protease subunit